ncbi:MAG TPA: hypothetical protein VD864_13605, partial [Nocardioides sp.]|nr:hypothetical protein [Nocardioides sp.]
MSSATSALRLCRFVCLLVAPALTAAAEGAWQETTWRGEAAFEASAGGWRAFVSVERARLVHFGPADEAVNLLFETERRDHPQGWGGHRVWL